MVGWIAGVAGAFFLEKKSPDFSVVNNRQETILPVADSNATADTSKNESATDAALQISAPIGFSGILPTINSDFDEPDLSRSANLKTNSGIQLQESLREALQDQNLLIRSQAALLIGMLPEAIEYSQIVIDDKNRPVSEVAEALRVKGIAYTYMGENAEAAIALETALLLMDSHLSPRIYLATKYEVAKIRLAEGNTEAACKILEYALSTLPREIESTDPLVRSMQVDFGSALIQRNRAKDARIQLQGLSILNARTLGLKTPVWVDAEALLYKALRMDSQFEQGGLVFAKIQQQIQSISDPLQRAAFLRRFALHQQLDDSSLDAEPMLREALAIRRKVENTASFKIRSSVFDLSECLLSQNKVEEALPLVSELLKTPADLPLPEARNYLEKLNKLTDSITSRGLFRMAEPLFGRTVSERNARFPKEPIGLARALYKHGWALQNLSEREGAEDKYLQAIKILNAQPNQEPELLISLCNQLGILSNFREKPEVAKTYFERSIKIASNGPLARSPMMIPAYDGLADMNEAADDLVTAEDLRRRALDISQQELGENHPLLGIRLNNIAAILQKRSQFAEAGLFYRKALFAAEQSQEPRPEELAAFCGNLVSLAQQTGNAEDAEKFTLRLIEVRSAELGPNNPDIAKIYNNLAMWMEKQGQMDRALVMYRQAVLSCYQFRKEFKKTSPHEKTCVANYTGILRASGQQINLEKELNGLLVEAGLL